MLSATKQVCRIAFGSGLCPSALRSRLCPTVQRTLYDARRLCRQILLARIYLSRCLSAAQPPPAVIGDEPTVGHSHDRSAARPRRKKHPKVVWRPSIMRFVIESGNLEDLSYTPAARGQGLREYLVELNRSLRNVRLYLILRFFSRCRGRHSWGHCRLCLGFVDDRVIRGW